MSPDPVPTTFMYRPSDYDAAVAFLRDVFGLEIVNTWDDDGRGTILAIGTARIEVFWDPDPAEAADQRPHRPTSIAAELPASIGWQVDDVDTIVDASRRAGANVLATPITVPWGTRMAVIAGPDGLRLCPFSISGQ